MMPSYAGIGKRNLGQPEADLIRRIGVQLARQEYTLRTGGALGSDREFAEGALDAGGTVRLCLPSSQHEKKWVRSTGARYGSAVAVEVLQNEDQAAFDSVRQYHPIGDQLQGYTVRIHARNYRIVVGPAAQVRFVVAWPREGGGGTAQGIRVAEDLGIPVVRLDQLNEDQVWALLRRFTAEVV